VLIRFAQRDSVAASLARLGERDIAPKTLGLRGYLYARKCGDECGMTASVSGFDMGRD